MPETLSPRREYWTDTTPEARKVTHGLKSDIGELPQFREAVVARFFREPFEFSTRPIHRRQTVIPFKMGGFDYAVEHDQTLPGKESLIVHRIGALERPASVPPNAELEEELFLLIDGEQMHIAYSVNQVWPYSRTQYREIPGQTNNEAVMEKAREFRAALS